ncbi:MAG: aldo/keto reductase [Alphaproteobacteria bacterium]|nr:aldo/keto reductase [Alphaproteobacteria bacterium]
MEYRPLGRSGLKVAPLCLGTMMFGGPTSEADSRGIIGRARDQGFNFLDTADVYNEGRSEEVVGRAIARDRDYWVLATKLANQMGQGPNDKGLSRKHAMSACEASLKRLGSDYIDLYYLHREDLTTPLAETVQAMGDLVRQGKIRYFALSNFRSWRLAEVSNLCDGLGIPRPAASQPYYNAFNRMPEVEHLPACAFYGLGIVPYSPLARGVLTGKYKPDADPAEGSRASRQDRRMMQTEWRKESLVMAQDVVAHAKKRGITPGQFATSWVLANPLVTAPIAGPRTMDQWEDYVGALSYKFTKEDEALIDGMVASGHPSTPGYNDPAYPIEGRPTAFGT